MITDTLIICRHGKPALSRLIRFDWRGYRAWWTQYDLGGLADIQHIPPQLIAYAAQADALISSPLLRAVETARLLRGGDDPDETWPSLVEAALPPPHIPGVKFGPRLWGTIARISWFFGAADDMESVGEARLRRDQAVQALSKRAYGGKFILVTAHGWYNVMMRHRLVRSGWRCVESTGDSHWGYRRYVRHIQKET